MEEKEFEKYFERIYAPIRKYVKNPCISNYECMKPKIKQILEEIWQSGYDKGLEKGTDMFLVELDR